MRSAGARTALTVADQAVSSVGNFAVSVLVARAASPAQYGAFAVGVGLYAVALSLHRAIVLDPLIIRYGDGNANSGAVRRMLSTSAYTSFSMTVVGVAIAVVLSGELARVVAVLATAGVGLLMFDAVRYVHLAAHRPHLALIADAAWSAGAIAVLVMVSPSGRSPALALGVWAAIGSAIGVSGALLLGWRGACSLRSWIGEHRGLSFVGAIEFVLVAGGAQAVILVLAARAGLDAAGAYRGALVLLGPVTTVNAGLLAASTVELSRVSRGGPRHFRRTAGGMAAGMSALVAVGGLVLAQLPDQVGVELLGETWSSSATLLLPLSLGISGTTITLVGSAALKVIGENRRAVGVSLAAYVSYFGVGCLAAPDGPDAVAAAMVPASLVGPVLMAFSLRKLRADQPSSV